MMRISCLRIVTHWAYTAAGTDGAVGGRAHPDDPAAGAAFTMEGNVDANGPQRRLRAPQAARECARSARPVRALN